MSEARSPAPCAQAGPPPGDTHVLPSDKVAASAGCGGGGGGEDEDVCVTGKLPFRLAPCPQRALGLCVCPVCARARARQLPASRGRVRFGFLEAPRGEGSE